MRNFFSQLVKNSAACFGKKYWLWHILAMAITFICVISGFDWWYFTNTRNPILQAILFPAVALGGMLPVIAPLVILAFAAYLKNARAKIFGLATLQAAILGFVISGLYKAFTGRLQPPLRNLSLVNISNGFRFGWLRRGVFWGWPSSHTTLAFAIGVTVFLLFPKNKLLRILFLAYAFYVGIGVSTNIHWFSDFAAGAIFGAIIGLVVAKSYLSKILPA